MGLYIRYAVDLWAIRRGMMWQNLEDLETARAEELRIWAEDDLVEAGEGSEKKRVAVIEF